MANNDTSSSEPTPPVWCVTVAVRSPLKPNSPPSKFPVNEMLSIDVPEGDADAVKRIIEQLTEAIVRKLCG